MMMKKIGEKIRMGMKPKMAIAEALAEKRRYAQGGYVDPEKPPKKPNPINYPTGASFYEGGVVHNDDRDEEEEIRSAGELQKEGMSHPGEVANPEELKEEVGLAHALRRMHEMEPSTEYFAQGGLVEGGPEEDQKLHGNQPEESMSSSTEEPMADEPKKPAAMDHMLSEEAKEAIRRKRAGRRYS